MCIRDRRLAGIKSKGEDPSTICSSSRLESVPPNPKPKVVIGAVTTDTESLKISIKKEGDKRWHKMCAIPDTGAGVSVMGTAAYKASGLPGLGPQMNLNIVSVDGRTLRQRGSIKTRVSTGSSFAKVRVAICDNVEGFYLDLNTCKRLRIVHEGFPQPMKKCCGIGVLSKPEGENSSTDCPSTVPEGWPPAEVWPDRN